MAKANKKRRKNGTTLPLAIVAPLAHTGLRFWNIGVNDSWSHAVYWTMAYYTGFLPGAEDRMYWNPVHLRNGLFPLAVGFGIHKLASKFGVNRMIAAAKIPWIRI